MVRKQRLPIFQKVSSKLLLQVSIVIAKMRKPIIPKLILLKKSQKIKKLKLMKNYNYGFLGEYQFSPSNSPLIQYRRPRKQLRYGGIRNVYSLFFLCRCLGRSLRDGGDHGDYSVEALPAAIVDGKQGGALLGPLDWEDDDEDDSIDLRAERFIERFYEEIRMQRQESL